MRAFLVLTPALAATLLAGCSANGGSAPPSGASSEGAPLAAHRVGWLAPGAKAGKHLLYVADQFGQTVYIFPQTGFNPPPVGAITDGIAGPDESAEYEPRHLLLQLVRDAGLHIVGEGE